MEYVGTNEAEKIIEYCVSFNLFNTYLTSNTRNKNAWGLIQFFEVKSTTLLKTNKLFSSNYSELEESA